MGEPVILENAIYHVNLTVIISIIAICLTAMGTLVAIFRKRPREEDSPGKTPFCIQNKSDLIKIEKNTKDIELKIDKLRLENKEPLLLK